MQTSPENPFNTLRDLETKIDINRGQITLQETSISQNFKTLTSQEYTISQNELRNNELIEFIKSNELLKESTSEEIKTLNDSKNYIINQTKDAKVELEETIRVIEKERSILKEEIENNNNKEKELEKLNNELKLNIISLDVREKEIDRKEELIKELLSKL